MPFARGTRTTAQRIGKRVPDRDSAVECEAKAKAHHSQIPTMADGCLGFIGLGFTLTRNNLPF